MRNRHMITSYSEFLFHKIQSMTFLMAALLTSACSLAPDFTMPPFRLPEAFKEQAPVDENVPTAPGEWKEATPLEEADRGQWWKIFADTTLNDLETMAGGDNPSLQAALARVDQSRAMVRANASTLLPTLELGANAARSQPSSAGVAAFGGNPNAQLNPYTLYTAGGKASYEVDLFARVHDNEKALSFEADAAEAMYRSLMLALQADVAQQYFTIRALDAERALLTDTVKIRQEANRIMQRRFELGEVGEQDYGRTTSELASAEAELLVLTRMRTNTEHALATLLGKLPSEFTLAEMPMDAAPPQIPAGLPSSLLERRPDIAAAIHQMQAANKRIGVARTAFFPRLILTASGGVESTTLADLFLWSNKTWALGQIAGSALSMTLFDSGRNLARVDAADAAYQESVANYRAEVLQAFKEVENALTDQRLLAEQSLKQDVAADAAKRTMELIRLRYDEGDVNYFEVVNAEQGALGLSRAALQTRGQRFITTVNLIRALGGGWDVPVSAETKAHETIAKTK